MTTLKRKMDSSDFDDRKMLRKMRKKTYETSVEAKQLWNNLRDTNLDGNKKSALSKSVYDLIVGKAAALVFAHDTSRVIQTFIKVASNEHKATIFEELKGSIILMMKSKFAKYVVRKFLKYGTKEQKLEILETVKGKVVVLMRHKEANEILEYIYNDFANASQRHSLEEEFYGPAYTLNKNKDTKSVVEFVSQFPDKKDSVMEFMKEILLMLIQKDIFQLSFVHKILYDYFLIASKIQQAEMIESIREHLPHFVHTKNGSRIVMKCLWNGTSKDRKAIIKSFKTFVVKICKEEFGHLVMLALFDCVDDTKLVQKALLDELLKGLGELITDSHGKKVVLYLLSHRDSKYFHPDVVEILSKGDGNESSKKEKSVRHDELLEYVSGPILEFLAKDAKFFIKENCLPVLQSIVTKATGDPSGAMKSVAELVALPFVNSPSKGFHFVDDASGHMTLKKIIENDVERVKRGETVLFSTILLETVSDENLKTWIECNRGCFLVAKLLELNHDVVTSRIKECLGSSKSFLKKSQFAGAQILLKKL